MYVKQRIQFFLKWTLLKVSLLCLVIIHAEPEASDSWVCNVFSMFSEGLAYWNKVTLFVLQYEWWGAHEQDVSATYMFLVSPECNSQNMAVLHLSK